MGESNWHRADVSHSVEVGRIMTGLSAESRARAWRISCPHKQPKVRVFIHSTVSFKDIKIGGAKTVVNAEI